MTINKKSELSKISKRYESCIEKRRGWRELFYDSERELALIASDLKVNYYKVTFKAEKITSKKKIEHVEILEGLTLNHAIFLLKKRLENPGSFDLIDSVKIDMV
jgi:hypothetical protein